MSHETIALGGLIRRLIGIAALCLTLAPAATMAQTILGLDPPAVQAVKGGDYVGLRSELLKGASPNLSDDTGLTLMMYAARDEFTDMIELLVQNDASLSAVDRDGNTALHWAVIQGRYGSVDTLVSLGANVNIQNRRGETPLMVAAREGDRDIVELILNAEPDFTIRDYSGRSALDYARNSRDSRVATMISEAGGN